MRLNSGAENVMRRKAPTSRLKLRGDELFQIVLRLVKR